MVVEVSSIVVHFLWSSKALDTDLTAYLSLMMSQTSTIDYNDKQFIYRNLTLHPKGIELTHCHNICEYSMSYIHVSKMRQYNN